MDVIRDTDVLYMTRIQKERFDVSMLNSTYDKKYCITNEFMSKAKSNTIGDFVLFDVFCI